MNNSEFILTYEQSENLFHMPTGTTTKTSVKSKIYHNLRYPTRTVDMVPALKHNSLMSAIKFMDANYIKVLIPEELLIYDVNEVTLRELEQAILIGRRYKTN